MKEKKLNICASCEANYREGPENRHFCWLYFGTNRCECPECYPDRKLDD